MPTVTISGTAQAFAKNPRAAKPITDRKTLVRFHGLVSEEACADLIGDPALKKLRLAGGRLRFVLAEGEPALRIATTYRVSRRPNETETQRLVEATQAQWSDGCGSGSFENFYGTVLSTALAMALINSGQKDDLGDYFVDAFPMFEDTTPRVEFSTDGVEQSDLDYLQEAVALGEPQAQFRLAQQLADGDGIKKDEKRAFELYQTAANQGHLLALTFLGLCHERGTGTPRDLARGVECFLKAAKQDVPLAMHCLGECYFEGRGVEANPGKGIKWYQRGVELGDVGCVAQLADCYEFGKGVAQDLPQALDFYEFCMEEGFDAVEPALKRVKKQLKRSGGK